MKQKGKGKEKAVAVPEPIPETESSSEPELEEEHDSEEDRLFEIELRHLKESNGQAEPLWHDEPEFRGMTRATRSIALRSRIVEGGESSKS